MLWSVAADNALQSISQVLCAVMLWSVPADNALQSLQYLCLAVHQSLCWLVAERPSNLLVYLGDVLPN